MPVSNSEHPRTGLWRCEHLPCEGGGRAVLQCAALCCSVLRCAGTLDTEHSISWERRLVLPTAWLLAPGRTPPVVTGKRPMTEKHGCIKPCFSIQPWEIQGFGNHVKDNYVFLAQWPAQAAPGRPRPALASLGSLSCQGCLHQKNMVLKNHVKNVALKTM